MCREITYASKFGIEVEIKYVLEDVLLHFIEIQLISFFLSYWEIHNRAFSLNSN